MLTKEQVDQLFVFCEKHFVRHYDVKMELVDHLANAIEDKMEADKNLSFESALNKVFSGFGIFGFTGIVNSRAQSLSKRYHKKRKEIFYSYFTWPKIAMSTCIFVVLLFLQKILTIDQLSYLIITLFFCLCAFELIVTRQAYRMRKKQTQKLLITEVGPIQPIFSVGFVAQVFLFFNRWSDIETYLKPGSFSYAIIISILIVLFVGVLAFMDLLKQVYQLAREQYPEAFIAAG